jgi:zinc transport system substrate-binding protein
VLRLAVAQLAALLLSLCFAAPAAATAPRVVVTLKPLHSLVAGVMEGIGEAELLVRGAGSPHTYGIRPSEAGMLEGAEVIFWVGGTLEVFMEKPLAALGSGKIVVEMMRAPGIAVLPGREGGVWDEHAGHEAAAPGHGDERDAPSRATSGWTRPTRGPSRRPRRQRSAGPTP